MDTKKLRQKILDLAIHGKLVPQDPNDEPASVLLERIKAEKERLIKEGKIKGSKKSAKTSDTPHYENVPFEVPDNWVWTTLGSVCNFENGFAFSSDDYKQEGIPLIRISNISDNTIDLNGCVFVQKEIEDRFVVNNGDLLIALSGATTGKMGVYSSDKVAYLNQRVGNLRIIDTSILSPEYRNIFMYSKTETILKLAYGGAQPNISGTAICSFLFPLPPLAEQRRIVTEVDHWLTLIDLIENEKFDLKISIKQAKSKILDLAIHGKLVPQDPNDEPAIELLKRINPNFTPCDNGHSEKLPQGWYSATINDVCLVIGGVSYNKADIQDTGIRVLRGGNIQSGKVFYCSDDVFIPFSYQNKENQVQYGDIIVVASTGSQTLIGKTGFVDRDIPKTQIGAFLRIVRPKQKTLSPYIRLLFQTDAYKDYIRNVAKGSNINNLKNAHLQNYQICLPPLAEQQRIVTKIEELFSVLDNIQNALEA